MKEKSTVLVSDSISEKVDFNQFYDEDCESSTVRCFIEDELLSISFPVLETIKTPLSLEISFTLSLSQLGKFLILKDLEKLALDVGVSKIVFENCKVSLFSSSVYHDSEYLCRLIVESDNIYSQGA
tara:strand:+ start:244 stop:621 length:378 start_codon:yes stop_codon:yes gene_type:complete